MSFGFSVGDVITASQLARSLWKGFADAPNQCKAVRSEVAGLYIVLDDLARSSSICDLGQQQKTDLMVLIQGCQGVLDAFDTILQKHGFLEGKCSGFRSKSKRAWERLRWDQGEISELRSRLVSNTTLLDAFNSSLSTQVNHEIKLGLEGLDQRFNNLQISNNQQERETIISWLSPLEFSAQHQDFIQRREPGTGRRFLGDEKFKNWLGGNHSQLFCPGIPGAGKTIMAASVVEYLQNTFDEYSVSNDIGTIYLYCNFRRELEQTALNLLGSLARQLAYQRPAVSEELQGLYLRHVDRRSRPGLDEVIKLIQIEIGRFTRVFIILDALDECINSHDTRRILASKLQDITIQTNANLLVTSRFIPETTMLFQDCPQLEIRAQVEDVKAYLHAQLDRLPKFVMRNTALQDTIVAAIANAVDGMFLLAQLHLDSLTDKTSPKAMKVALEKLPKGSDALKIAYNSAVERIDAQKSGLKELANQVLSWITIARRPLRTEELQHALAIELDETYLDEDNFSDIEEMLGVCAGLVTIDENSKVIRFIHYTTQEYFESIRQIRFSTAADHVALSCITYLMYDDMAKQPQQQLTRKYPLVKYAAEHWGHHIREGSQPLLTPSALRLLQSDEHLMMCIHLCTYISLHLHSSPQVALFVAASFGLENAVRELIATGADVNCKLDGETALYVACSRGFVGVVDLLLEAGADIELTGGSRGTALSTAAYHGYNGIVKRLIPRSFTWWRHGTALQEAISGGHISTVQLLLAEGADINSHFGRRDNLLRAVENGNESIVQLFLDRGVTKVTSRVIEIAARHGNINIVQSLIRRGIEQGAVKELVQKGVFAAASRGHKDIVQFLFELESDIDVTNALVEASRNGNLDMISFLCDLLVSYYRALSEFAASIPIYDSYCDVELESEFELLPRFLSRDLKIEGEPDFVLHFKCNAIFGVSNATWHAMLDAAVSSRQEDIVAWLSARRGTLQPTNTLVKWASESSDFKIVEILWNMFTHSHVSEERDIKRIWKDAWAKQLLRASVSGNIEVIQMLLSNDVPVNPTYEKSNEESSFNTPLLASAWKGHPEVSPFNTPLLAAAWKGHPEVVRLLLKHGAMDENKESHTDCSDAELDQTVVALIMKWDTWWRKQTRVDWAMRKASSSWMAVEYPQLLVAKAPRLRPGCQLPKRAGPDF